MVRAELSPKLIVGPLLRGQPIDRKFLLAFWVSANMGDFYHLAVNMAFLRLLHRGG